MSEPIVLYHGSCEDGFTAAWAVSRVYPSAEFIPMTHGKEFDVDVKGRDVIAVDISWPRSVVGQIKADAKSLIILDHHESAQKALEGLDYCVFDMEQSGAMLAWKHFNPETEPPLLVKYVQDRDLWRWELVQSREFNAAVSSYEKTFDNWSRLATMGGTLTIEGVSILRLRKQHINKIVSLASEGNFRGFRARMVNSSIYESELGEALYQDPDCEVAIVWSQMGNGVFRYSLRSSEDGPKVNVLAEEFGGGGHPHAAGFTLNSLITLS